MIKLIRGVRQNLVMEGNIKKYLLYAIGEILLVMIGILLALQVNNWNQNRIDNKKEKKALVDLYEQFKLNQQRIEEKQNLRITLTPKLEQYINSISNGKANYQSFQDYHYLQFMVGMTNPSNGVIDALISSGELALISNDSLKYFLADWKDQVGNLRENEEILWNVTLDYSNYFQRTIPDSRIAWKDWDEQKINQSFSSLISDIAYRNKLLSYHGCQKIVIEECKVVLDFIDKTLRIIEQEIESESTQLGNK